MALSARGASSSRLLTAYQDSGELSSQLVNNSDVVERGSRQTAYGGE
jgi:hypothetical protein